MRNRMRVSWTSAAALLVLAAMVGLLALSGTALAKKPDKPGGGGGEPVAPDPITDKSRVYFCVNFRNDPADGVRSDGLWSLDHPDYDYSHGEDKVGCGSGKVGKAYLTTEGTGKKVPALRRVHLDLRVDDPDRNVPFVRRDSHVTLKFRTSTGKFLGQMSPGEVDDTLGMRLFFFDDAGNTWHLVYDPDDFPGGPDCGGLAGTVTRVDDFTWTIEGTWACLSMEGPTPVVHGPVWMPFKMTWTDDRWVRYQEQLAQRQP